MNKISLKNYIRKKNKSNKNLTFKKEKLKNLKVKTYNNIMGYGKKEELMNYKIKFQKIGLINNEEILTSGNQKLMVIELDLLTNL